ncbi:MAG: GAF domain-containing protein [Sphingobium sp.]
MLTWGPQLTLLYNGAYAQFLGGKHPSAIGRPFAEVLADIRSDVKPLVDQALSGEAIWFEDHHLVMRRNGYAEDTWWQFSYSPLRDNGVIVGILNVTSDMTGKVLTERRQAFRIALDKRLRDLTDPTEVIAATTEALGRHLGADQVGYAEVEPGGETVLIDREWNHGAIMSNAKRHRLDDFGPAFIADLRNSKTVAVADVRLDPRTSSEVALATFTRASIRAFLDVLIVKAGKLAAVIAVHSGSPRTWSAEDIALVESPTIPGLPLNAPARRHRYTMQRNAISL